MWFSPRHTSIEGDEEWAWSAVVFPIKGVELKAEPRSLALDIMRTVIIYHSVLILLLTSPVRTNFYQQLLQDDDCPPLKGPIREVAEKICEFCHELFSHEKPNMRAECRAGCFSTDAFRSCVNIFSKPTRRHTRSRHRIQHIWS